MHAVVSVCTSFVRAWAYVNRVDHLESFCWWYGLTHPPSL